MDDRKVLKEWVWQYDTFMQDGLLLLLEHWDGPLGHDKRKALGWYNKLLLKAQTANLLQGDVPS